MSLYTEVYNTDVYVHGLGKASNQNTAAKAILHKVILRHVLTISIGTYYIPVYSAILIEWNLGNRKKRRLKASPYVVRCTSKHLAYAYLIAEVKILYVTSCKPIVAFPGNNLFYHRLSITLWLFYDIVAMWRGLDAGQIQWTQKFQSYCKIFFSKWYYNAVLTK